jgi:hypothetical protein
MVALAWVYFWAVRNNSAADFEHERLVVAALISCGLLAAAIVLALVVDSDGHRTPATLLRAGAAGAFVAVAASSASTLLIAMAISPVTDPGDFDRTIFRPAYTSALVLSLGAGFAAAWTSLPKHGARNLTPAAMAITLVLTLAAWIYLATGSSELNQCEVNDEFPLATDHVCSGY